MSNRLIFASALLVALSFTAPASAHERYYDFNQVWDQAIGEHRRDEVLSAPTGDIIRQRPSWHYQPGSHDPSGRIILEGAQ